MTSHPPEDVGEAGQRAGLPPVDWVPPGPGAWLRSFRLGEWLDRPLSPLFETWVVRRAEDRIVEIARDQSGMRLGEPLHHTVNGWCYTSPFGTRGPEALLGALLRRPWFIAGAVALGAGRPEIAHRLAVGRFVRAWHDEVGPALRERLAQLAEATSTAPPEALAAHVDRTADAVGEAMWSLSMVGGTAWKVEAAMTDAAARLLPPERASEAPWLLLALGEAAPGLDRPLAQSLDWAVPPAPPAAHAAPAVDARWEAASRARRRTVDSWQAALRDRPRAARRLARLVRWSQAYGRLRETQAGLIRHVAPIMRQAALELGQTLVDARLLDAAEDVWFLREEELRHALASGGWPAGRRPPLEQRRQTWLTQAQLNPPAVLGRMPPLLRVIMPPDAVAPPSAPLGAGVLLRGVAGAPGRARGTVLVATDPSAVAAAEAGTSRILVTGNLTPAWLPVLAVSAGVVADAGTLAAHACLIARELGVPAVVGTVVATTVLRDGMVVEVDGTAGVVSG